MPFKFADVCDLLTQLEGLKLRDPPLLSTQLCETNEKIVQKWFKIHRRQIDAPDTDRLALLSTLFPERRTDRLYGMQEARLSRVVARLLAFSSDRFVALQAYKTPGNGDLGACLERVTKVFDCEKRQLTNTLVTVEDVDYSLHALATQNGFSSPAVRSGPVVTDPMDVLQSVLRRLRSSEAKWLIRILLKNLSPVVLDPRRVLHHVHFLLPGLLRFQDSFASAVQLLGGPLKRYPSAPDIESARVFRQDAAQFLQPTVGVKVGRPHFFKARSVTHCLTMVGRRKWAVERKYDGEYCEIHIDLSQGSGCIRIFSKSGRDSTEDRKAVHDTIRQALRLHQPSCIFKRRCIVVGELLVYSDEEQTILGFHELRKHVRRAGRFIGTEQDCRPATGEHLMIVFFDLLLLDDCVVMSKSYEERRQILARLVRKREGYAITSERRTVDFGKTEARNVLLRDFAFALAARAEGLILKPADLPYFPLTGAEEADMPGYYVKMKRDHMPELGGELDVADLAIIGGSYDSKLASRLDIRNLQFTAFHLGCVTNPENIRFGGKPIFEVVATIHADGCVPARELEAINNYGHFSSKPVDANLKGFIQTDNFDIKLDGSEVCRIAWTFNEPCVVEVLGSGYEKPSNKAFFTLRHPRMLKLHLDRSWTDATTFEDLQSMASTALNAPVAGEAAEFRHILERLMNKVKSNPETTRHTRFVSRNTSNMPTPPDQADIQPRPASKAARRQRQLTSPTPLVRIDMEELLQPEPQAADRNMLSTTMLSASRSGSNTLPTPSLTLSGEDSVTLSACRVRNSKANLDAENIPPSKGKRKLSVREVNSQESEPKRVRIGVSIGSDNSIES